MRFEVRIFKPHYLNFVVEAETNENTPDEVIDALVEKAVDILCIEEEKEPEAKFFGQIWEIEPGNERLVYEYRD